MTDSAPKACEYCGLELANASERKRFCDAKCRAAAWRNDDTSEVLADVEPGENLAALDAMLLEIAVTAADGPLIAAARALARQVDRRPTDSSLWSRYLDVLEQLREAVSTREDTALREAMDEIAAASPDTTTPAWWRS